MLCFLDTSALQYRYLHQGTAKAQSFRRKTSDKRNSCFISTITILEIARTFGNHCRKNNLPRSQYRRLDNEFWTDVQSGLLQLREPSKRDYRKALHLLEYAGAGLYRNLGSADALIAASCLEFALENATPVTFCLDDWTLFSITSQLPSYTAAIKFHYIGPMKTPLKPVRAKR